MRYSFKNTKIVSTFGPSITGPFSSIADISDSSKSSDFHKSKNLIGDLFKNGVDCVRFNFSNGLSEENNARIFLINDTNRGFYEAQSNNPMKFLKPVAFMADTKGPEIRVFDMSSKEGIFYERGETIVIDCIEKKKGSKEGFSVVDATGTYNMANDCFVGGTVLVEDGKLTLRIIEVNKSSGKVKVIVENSHTVKTNKRINLPGADYSMDFLSDKDINDIKYAIDNGFEYVALSFVNTKKDIESVRSLICSYCAEKQIPNFMKVYSKIETFKSCENIDEIVEASDGIMIARGDLGLEIMYYEVPYWTKQIIKRCFLKRKPVIVATQMLDSLERNVLPTRAEVSDVYRAAELGSDCTMLSGETAQGNFPDIAVKTMANIVYESEKHFNVEKFETLFEKNLLSFLSDEYRQKCLELRDFLSKNKHISCLILTQNSATEEFIKVISSMRLNIPVIYFVLVHSINSYFEKPNFNCCCYKKIKVASSLSLHRGIIPVVVEGAEDDVSELKLFDGYVSARKLVDKEEIGMSSNFAFLDNGVWKLN